MEEGHDGKYYIMIENRAENEDSFRQMYGGFLFLGIFLGILFLMITVLIIFYKQISEGYEDKERFAIMEKVGMSNAEVKRPSVHRSGWYFYYRLLPLHYMCWQHFQ